MLTDQSLPVGSMVTYQKYVRPYETVSGKIVEVCPDIDWHKPAKYRIENSEGEIVTRYHPRLGVKKDGTFFLPKEEAVMIENILDVVG